MRELSNSVCIVGVDESDELGTLRVGTIGDAAVLHLQDGEYTFVDAAGLRAFALEAG